MIEMLFDPLAALNALDMSEAPLAIEVAPEPEQGKTTM